MGHGGLRTSPTEVWVRDRWMESAHDGHEGSQPADQVDNHIHARDVEVKAVDQGARLLARAVLAKVRDLHVSFSSPIRLSPDHDRSMVDKVGKPPFVVGIQAIHVGVAHHW